MRDELSTYGPVDFVSLIVIESSYGQGNDYVAQASALYNT
jgi:hypothetical protein